MGEKIVATAGIVVGALGSLVQLLVAFGINVSPDQHTAMASVGGVLLMVMGVWLHPNIPLGVVKPTEESPPELGTSP